MGAVRALAPAIPHWITMGEEAAMQVDEGVLKCAVFLGVPTERGFCADGSGFFMFITEEDLDFTYVVTCRHVVRPFEPRRSTTPNPEKIWIRANTRKDHKPREIPTVRGDWICHQDKSLDICVYPFDVAKWDADDSLDIARLETHTIVLHENLEKHVALSLGDEVFIPGCFVGRVGELRNIPVVRVGNIAALPYEPVWGASPRHPAYLIETKSLGGISGSPVFLHLLPTRHVPPRKLRAADGKEVNPALLIGIMQGLHSGNYHADFVGDDPEAIIPPVPADVDFNAGIGVTIPIKHILEMFNHPTLKEARLATIKAKKKDSGFREASASPRTKVAGPPPDEIVPSDRERFNSLLNAAAQKREQEG